MINIPNIPSSLSDAFGLETQGVSSIVAEGLGGFYSDIKIQEKQTYESTVPDIPIEDGSYIHDHIILKPEIIDVVGRVTPFHFGQRAEKFTSTPSQIVDTLNVFLPKKTAFQLRKIRNQTVNAIDTIDSYLSGFNNIFNNFKSDKTDLMQVFNDFMREIIKKKILVDIKMPLNVYKNMRITSLVLTTDNEANALDYEFTAKQIIIAESKFTKNVFSKGADVENNGIVAPQNVSQDVCKNIMIKGEACQ